MGSLRREVLGLWAGGTGKTATGPVLFGAVAEYGYFDEGYLVLAGVVAVVTLLALRMPRA